jgi:FkbH-like protein
MTHVPIQESRAEGREAILARLDARPTVAAYAQAAQDLKRLDGPLRRMKVCLMSGWTTAPLEPFVIVEAARWDLVVSIATRTSATVIEDLLVETPASPPDDSDVVFVSLVLDDLCPAFGWDFLRTSDRELDSLRDQLLDTIGGALHAFRRRSAAALVVHNFPLPAHPLLGVYEGMAGWSQTAAIRQLNNALATGLRRIPGTYVLDLDRVCGQIGYDVAYDDRMWLIGRVALSGRALPALAREQAGFLQALAGGTRKCVVVDLDNTLWGGILGEVGAGGIALGRLFPGNAFRRFQQYLRQLVDRGVLLAINSKNDPADVDAVLATHPEMVLRGHDVAARRVNWLDKADNVREIAAELGLTLDSLVFVDDSPVECARVRDALPDVLTVQLPADPACYVRALASTGAFDRIGHTDEDSRRTALYRQRAEGERAREIATSLDEFLAGLQMRLQVAPVGPLTASRVFELVHKTNQFNLTTRRYTADALTRMIDDPSHGVFSARLIDRFGDHGLIGAAFVRQDGALAVLDNLLLSCRVINRTVESALLKVVVDWARSRGAEALEGEFVPTRKNTPAKAFFQRHGFTRTSNGSSSERWRLAFGDGIDYPGPRCIQIEWQESAAS